MKFCKVDHIRDDQPDPSTQDENRPPNLPEPAVQKHSTDEILPQ